MKGLLIVIISAALLFSCKDEKAECEQYNLGSYSVKNNNQTSSYILKTAIKKSDGSYSSSSNHTIQGGETWVMDERSPGDYKIQVYTTGLSLVSEKFLTVQTCKRTEISIP